MVQCLTFTKLPANQHELNLYYSSMGLIKVSFILIAVPTEVFFILKQLYSSVVVDSLDIDMLVFMKLLFPCILNTH